MCGKKKYIEDNTFYRMDSVLVDKTYNPNPIDFRSRLRAKINEIYNVDLEEYIEANIEANKSRTRLVKAFKSIAPIRICYNTIHFNVDSYDETKVLDMIDSVANERFDM